MYLSALQHKKDVTQIQFLIKSFPSPRLLVIPRPKDPV